MREHKAEVSCTAGAAKPDSGQAGGGEDFMRQHEAEVPNSPNGNSVNIDRHVAILEKMGSATINYHPSTLIQEPAISKAEIERVSSCPLPELDTGQKNLIQRGTLTEAIDWKIFVTCTLKSWHLMDLSQDLDKDEERQLFQAYLPIQPTNSYHDAFEFIIVSILSSLYQNTGAGLNPDEQLGFFERVFLVTKLRTLTQLEKTFAEEILRRHGLYATLKNYILNWYISNTYFKYFNYSKNPDGRYQVARLWGMIQDSSGQPATGASYQLIDANISGHVLFGKTGGKQQTRLNRLRALLPGEETRYAGLTGTSTPNFSYNMELQFYLPIEQFKKDAAGEVTSDTITPHPTVSVLVEALGRSKVIQKIPLKHRFTHDASIMIPETKVINFTPIPYTQSTSPLVIGEVQGSFQKIRSSPIVEQKGESCPNSTSAALRAVIYARDMGAHITNNSWSQHFNGSQITRKVLENTIYMLNDAYGSGRLNTAGKREDLLHVFGTGNKSVDLTIPDAGYFDAPTMCTDKKTKEEYPCISALNYLSIENKLLVAASNENDQKSNFSNYGSRLVDLAAPGGDIDNNRNIEDGIYSTVLGNGYAKKVGTSMASPHVAGVEALIMAYRPTLRGKPLLVKQSILQSADTPQTLKNTRDCPDKGGMPADCVVNGRRLNAYNALRASVSPKITGLSLTPGMEQMRLQWRVVTSHVLGIDITYEIRRVHDGKTTIRKTAVTHFTDTGLRSGTRYTYHVRAVKSNGIRGTSSGVGTSTTKPLPPPEPLPPTMEHFGSHTCAVKNRNVYCWGRNDFGQLGDGSKELYKDHVVAPVISSDLYDIPIAVGPYHTCTAKERNIHCWGRNDHGQLGDKRLVDIGYPKLTVRSRLISSVVTGINPILDIQIGSYVYGP